MAWGSAQVVERLRGEPSPWAPWLAALPASVATPLTYSDAQLAELAGTSLHRATRHVPDPREYPVASSSLAPACAPPNGLHHTPESGLRLAAAWMCLMPVWKLL